MSLENSRPLAAYGVHNSATLHLILRLKGGERTHTVQCLRCACHGQGVRQAKLPSN